MSVLVSSAPSRSGEGGRNPGKTAFLERVMTEGRSGDGLRTDCPYVAENAKTACEALNLGLVRVAPDRGLPGHVLRITPGGMHLVMGQYEQAAAAIASGSTPTRIMGADPEGRISFKIYDGGPPAPLGGALVRSNVSEVLRCIATGHYLVEDGCVRTRATGRGLAVSASDRRAFLGRG